MENSGHLVSHQAADDLMLLLQEAANLNVAKAICWNLPTLAKLQHKFIELKCNNTSDPNEEQEIIPSEHNRAHIDIFSTGSKYFLTCIDNFTKFIKPQLLQLLNIFSGRRPILCENEKSKFDIVNTHTSTARQMAKWKDSIVRIRWIRNRMI